MKLRWILPPLATLVAGVALWIWLSAERRTAGSLLASAEERLGREPRDESGALREMAEALRLADLEGDAALRARILGRRSRLYQERNMPVLALADCQTLLGEFGQDAGTLELASRLSLELADPGQALELAQELEALDADRAQKWIGECHVALADVPLALLEQRLKEVLPDRTASAVSVLAQRAAIFSGTEVKGAAALEELVTSLPDPAERRVATELVQQAAEHLSAARAAFVRSLEPAPGAGTVAGLQDLLLRAGADLEAADLGTVALELRRVQPKMPILARTVGALLRLGREHAARELIRSVQQENPAALRPEELSGNRLRDELYEWCRVLEHLELWSELRVAAEVLERRCRQRRDYERAPLASFLAGMAELRSGRPDQARRQLEKVQQRPPRTQDIPVRTWLALAEIARLQHQTAEERYALLMLTKAAPRDPDPPLRSEIGAAWLRLSEMQQKEGDESFHSLTQALRLSSERAAELEPRWHEQGARTLQVRGWDGPYQRYTFARSQLEQGQPGRALSEARDLLEDYPGLAPALVIAMQSAYRLRDESLGIQCALSLLERGHLSLEASSRLRATSGEYFQAADRVRWLRADPRGSLESVVQGMLDRGEFGQAVLTARASPPQFQSSFTQVLVSRVLFDARDAAHASGILALIPPDDAAFPGAAGLVLRAALEADQEAGTVEVLDGALERVLASGTPRAPELLVAADALLASDRLAEAAELVGWLGSDLGPWTGEVLLREAALRAIQRGSEPGDETLERAIPFFDDGRGELGRLVLAVDRADWGRLASEARLALAGPLGSTPRARALLLGLAGDVRSGAEILAVGDLHGRDPLRVMGSAGLRALGPPETHEDSTGSDGEPGGDLPLVLPSELDPRAWLVLLLCCEHAPWSAWTLQRLGELSPVSTGTAAEPWCGILRALARLAQGEEDRAARELERLTEDAAGTGPDLLRASAWELRAHILERGRGAADPARRLDCRLGWLEASGVEVAGDPALLELEAVRLDRAGQRDEAVRLLEEALEGQDRDPLLIAALARLENVPGRRARAVALYSELFRLQPGAGGGEHVLEALEALRSARAEGEITELRCWNELEALETELPEDPAVAREVAARILEQQSRRRDATALAFQRLERFRERTQARPVESLRRGEATRWTTMLASKSPERALRFAEEELLADPSNTELWRNACEARLAAGRWKEGLNDLEALQRVAPERETVRLHTLARFSVQADGADLLARLANIASVDPTAITDQQLLFCRGLALLERSTGDELARAAIEVLELWKARAENGLAERFFGPRLGRTVAVALFRAGYAYEAIDVLEEESAAPTDALERDLLDALLSLMRVRMAEPDPLRPREPEPPEETRASDDVPGTAGETTAARPEVQKKPPPKAGAKGGRPAGKQGAKKQPKKKGR